MTRIGFVGAGLMGHGIATNLLNRGFDLTVIANRNRIPIDNLVARGAREASVLDEIGRAQDVVVLCLPSSLEVEATLAKLEAVLSPGSLVIDVTTADPKSTVQLAQDMAARGIDVVDAPVTRGPDQAAAGALISLVGATDKAFAKAEPIIDAYSEKIIRMGEPGAGHTAKLLNNFVTQTYVAVIAQAYTAAREAGVDWAALYAAMSRGAAKSGTLEKMIPPALEANYRGHAFALKNALKDVRYAEALLRELHQPTGLVEAVAGLLQAQADAGNGERWVSELLAPELALRSSNRS